VRLLAALLAGAVIFAGCDKPPPSKIDTASERAAASKRAQEGAFGTQVKAHESAKALGDDLNRKALEGVEKAEK